MTKTKAKAEYHQPTSDELAALRSYAKECGRTWKASLAMDWYYARTPWCPDMPNRGSILHGLRNNPRFGPKGLDAFKFPTE